MNLCAVAGNENATILDEERKKTFEDAIDVALASNQEMIDKFVSLQTAIYSRTCVEYAQQQYGLTKGAYNLNEDIYIMFQAFQVILLMIL